MGRKHRSEGCLSCDKKKKRHESSKKKKHHSHKDGKYIHKDLVQMDLYWQDHELLSRLVITDLAYGLPCLRADLDWLLLNQDKIGENFGHIVRDSEVGRKLGIALREHIMGAVEVFTAVKNRQNYSDAYRRWMENAALVGRIYNEGSSSIDEEIVRQYMIDHNNNALKTAQDIIASKCVDAVKDGIYGVEQIGDLSDYLIDRLN
jgi:hypothetical protein